MNPPSKDVIIFLILSYLVVFSLLLNVSWQALAFASDAEGLFHRRVKGKTTRTDIQKNFPALNPHATGPGFLNSSPDLRSLPYRLVKSGMEFVGLRYRWQGMSERTGVDCSGLVKMLFEKFGIQLPHSSNEQFKMGEQVAKSELQIGDLVFFSSKGKSPNHVGLYVGHDQFLHAASDPGKVIVTALDQPWYAKRFLGARRILALWKDDHKLAEGRNSFPGLNPGGRPF
jgi:NlpC/P60 family